MTRIPEPPDGGVGEQVRAVLAELRSGGAPALRRLAERYDGLQNEMEVPRRTLDEARSSVPAELLAALEQAAERIRAYQVRALPRGFTYDDGMGNRLTLAYRPVGRVGVYVPGGRAPYPSTVLMTVIPARVAGVGEVVLCTPRPDPAVLAAAAVAGVDRVFRLGGAHAVGAMAWGVDPVPRCDVVVGPGNRYVAEAKRQLYGQVGIEALAGPSEIAVVADDTADPDWVAADLAAQAEHGPDSVCVLIAVGEGVAGRVRSRLTVPAEVRVVADLEAALAAAEELAPEHLSLQCRGAAELAARVRRAGAVFVGPFAPVAAGDYAAGTNHVLPTGGTARYASGLSAADFVRRVQIFEGSREGVAAWAPAALTLARAEGFAAHANSVEVRMAAAPGRPAPHPAAGHYVPPVPAGAARLDLNENPHPWPAEVWERVLARVRETEPNRYPRAALRLQEAVAAYAGVEPDRVLVGNGSDELILAAVGALAPRVRRVVVPTPTFGMYRRVAEALGVEVVGVPLGPDFALDVDGLLRAARSGGESLLFLSRPNNPTGNLWPAQDVDRLLAEPGLWTVVDEAYFEFCGETLAGRIEDAPRLIILRTLSKAFALAGLRVGYALARPGTLAPLRQAVQPWAVGVFSQAAAEVLLTERWWVRERVADICRERERLFAELAATPGIVPYPSRANFVLFRVAAGALPAAELFARLRDEGVALRRWPDEPALADALRVSVGTREDDDRFLAVLRRLTAPARREVAGR